MREVLKYCPFDSISIVAVVSGGSVSGGWDVNSLISSSINDGDVDEEDDDEVSSVKLRCMVCLVGDLRRRRKPG